MDDRAALRLLVAEVVAAEIVLRSALGRFRECRHLDQRVVFDEARLPIIAIVVEHVLVEPGPHDIVAHHVKMRLEFKAAWRNPDLDGAGMANTGELLVEIEMRVDPGLAEAEHDIYKLRIPRKRDVHACAE